VLGSGSSVDLEDLPGRILTRGLRVPSDTYSYRDGVNVARKELVLRALSRAKGNRAAAARMLGLEAKYLLKLMKALHIE
jgi:transcriptional regulator with GAF, ATPase, and Fis domain